MRKTPFCALLFSVGYLFFVSPTGAQMCTAHARITERAGKQIVQVSLNGTGPYDFILDTGANITLVESRLLQQLHMSAHESVTIDTSLGTTPSQQAMLASIAVGGIVVQQVAVDSIEPSQLGAHQGHVRGVLGENFLKYFDVLIDNEQQILTLDQTSGLQDALSGEHLQLLRFGSFNGSPTADRIVVRLTVPSFLQQPLLFLVDSGTNTAMLYPSPGLAWRAMQSSQQGRVRSLDDSQNCQYEKAKLELGSGTFRGIELAACKGLTRNKTDTDGLLPTHIFRQLFISHRGAYVIANPRRSR
jgi:predicted aspartyl protease